ncbi:hypothetical protein M2R41_32165, partial [Pseudomonas aeruginosa]|nr:hypothetical protein [Pseudomonas aeruginosa]MDI9286836.1 hypothetical protein [Pseudomonas aeruginosa]
LLAHQTPLSRRGFSPKSVSGISRPLHTKQNWIWVYLSALLGEDLRESSLCAYHDGGMFADEDYDDDQGGPMYVAGHEGIELQPLSAADDAEARRLADEYFSRIDPAGR